MNAAAIAPLHARTARVFAFAYEVHPPATYLIVAASWSFSLMTLLQSSRGEIRLDPAAYLVGAIFFLILLYLRALDEIKDLEYDKLYNPSRPLVRGAVSVGEVWSLAALTAVVVLLLSASLGATLVLFAAIQMAYGIGLLVLERSVVVFRRAILLNLFVTFPVSAALNFYVLSYLTARGLAPGLQTALPIVAAHIGIFLHLEFGRKLKWPEHTSLGENGYVLALGVRGAVATCVLFGALACSLATWVQLQNGARWFAALPWLAMLPSILGLRRFFTGRERSPNLKAFFGAAMVVFFLLNIALAFASAAKGGKSVAIRTLESTADANNIDPRRHTHSGIHIRS